MASRDRIEASMHALLETVARLRGPGGCEWDRSQTVGSLRPFLLEEAFEVADAAEREDWASLRDELGDLLLHILMDAMIAEEGGFFDLADVADGIRGKLVRRHPHVFGDPGALSPGEVERQWERIKSEEKADEGLFDSIPGSLPALQTAWRIQQRASDLGYERDPACGPPDRSGSEAERLVSLAADEGGEEGIGRLLFDVVDSARKRGFEPENALRKTCRAFMDRLESWRG